MMQNPENDRSGPSEADRIGLFESQRPHLLGLGYRILGSRAEAEDVVQEAWLRWSRVDMATVEQPRAFLMQTMTRLCLDHLKAARTQRELYVGEWLPEPVLDDDLHLEPGPERLSELAQDLSFAFMRALERLSPLERVAFLLRDVFDLDFPAIADTLGRSEAACRQLASRARGNLRDERVRFQPSAEEGQRLLQSFGQALASGDVAGLAALLAQDATFVSDGGGRVAAISRPLIGREPIAKAIIGFAKAFQQGGAQVQPAQVNGMLGVVIHDALGQLVQTVAFELDAKGLISGIYVQRNPDKLRHLMTATGRQH